MFLYENKKPAVSTKASSSNKSADSFGRVHFNSSDCQNNRQEFNFIIQKLPIPTANPPKSGFAAGSPRPPQNELSPDFLDDVIFIENVLSNNDLKKLIESGSDKTFRCRVEGILNRWKVFLPQFLKRCGFKSYGANQSHTFHKPGSKNAAETTEHHDSKQMPKINSIYEGSLGKRTSREYTADEAIKRYLRHCTAALRVIFHLADEIQCYYDNEDKMVYIAANSQCDENKLSPIDNKQFSVFSGVLQYSLKELKDILKCSDCYNSSPILSEFRYSLSDAFSSSKMTEEQRRLNHKLECPTNLYGAKIYVIKSGDINVNISGLHAERKILYYLRSKKNNNDLFLDPLRIGGMRRPCFVCSALCFEDMSQVRPGPCWVSKAASTPKNIKEMFLILEAIRNNENITYITDQHGQLKTDCDTESSEGSEFDLYPN